MANQIPMLEGTDAAGGFLVPDEVRETLVTKLRRDSAVPQVVTPQQTAGKRAKYPVYAGRPVVSVTGEGEPKAVTGAEYTSLTVNIVKFTAMVLYTQELLEDAREDPTVLVNQDVESAFANAIDAHALGMAAGSAITGEFDVELTATTQSDELGTGADAIATAVSAAMGRVESNGYTPTGIILASDLRQVIRDARNTVETAQPLYQAFGEGSGPASFYGTPIAFSSNLDAVPAGGGKVAGVVLDASAAKLLIRKDITIRTSTEATVDVSAELDGTDLRHLFQENLTAVLWEMRAGFNVLDINKSVSKIANAS